MLQAGITRGSWCAPKKQCAAGRGASTQKNFDYSGSQRLLSPVWSHLSDLVVESAEGCWITTVNGGRYLDFSSGIGVVNTGHRHPKVVQAIRQQIEHGVLHAQLNIMYHKSVLELAARLSRLVPQKDLSPQMFFSNSGAEAVEAAIKLSRHATKKQNIICFEGSLHGRTIGTMSISHNRVGYRTGYQPLMSGVFTAPFPYCLHCSKKTGTVCCQDPIADIEKLLLQSTSPSETAAVIIEPVQGEGGYIPAPNNFLQSLRGLCTQHNILLIVDEIQTGFGRTGKLFATEHSGVIPDITIFAKGIASGMPLSGISASSELMSRWLPGSHGGTYGGNAVSCAAAVATIDIIEEENLLANANERGKQLREGLETLKKKFPVRDIRGEGLMIGLEFDSLVPTGTATQISQACLKQGLVLLTTSIFETVRLIPPLTITSQEIDMGLDRFKKACESVFSK